MKKRICMLLAAAMCLSFTGCGSSQKEEAKNNPAVAEESHREESEEKENAEKQKHFVFVTPLIAHEVWLVAKEGFDDACTEYGIRGDWVGPSTIDANEMIKQIETAIAEKADGIITQGMNPEAMVPVLEKAKEAGIPLVVVNSDIPDGPRLGYLGTEPIHFGRVGAEYLIEVMGDQPIHAAYMTSALDYSIGLEMIDGYEQGFANAPGGYNQVTIAADNSDLMTAVQQWENIFTTYPECNVAICVEASASVAAAKVIEEKGLTGIYVMGIDDMAETLDYIDKGVISGTMTQNFYRMGYEPVQWIVDYMDNGTELPKLLNDSGTMVVTKDNLDTYAEDMKVPSAWE